VAHRYDLANHLLSLNMDRYWRARTVSRVRDVLREPGAKALDLCCGTGDLLLALEAGRGGAVWGSDFCHPMLTAAAEKIARRGGKSRVFEADALQMPVRDASFNLVTVAFGFRNLVDYAQGLEEMRRVLRSGGVAAILEFSQPPNPLFAAFYNLYSRRVLPAIGGALSGSKDAYQYLPESVRKFPSAEELAQNMRDAGFGDVSFERITGGIVCLHLGRV
jgi:demethylmenaquinone methyltransferase/2-methoxy-6-polyprenyl-1,4-benzoquinol methylase